eukprot:3308335-Prymnesium_polylepis.1
MIKADGRVNLNDWWFELRLEPRNRVIITAKVSGRVPGAVQRSLVHHQTCGAVRTAHLRTPLGKARHAARREAQACVWPSCARAADEAVAAGRVGPWRRHEGRESLRKRRDGCWQRDDQRRVAARGARGVWRGGGGPRGEHEGREWEH